MTPRICTFLLLLTACQLDPKTIGDPTGASSGESDTDGASSEPMSTSQGGGSEPATTDVSDSESDTTPGTSVSGTTGVDPSEGHSTGVISDGGSTGVGTSESDGDTEGVVIMCQDGPEHFPNFTKICQTDDDCAIGNHAIDCCGSLHAIGIHVDTEQAFMEAEQLCQSQFPLCDCAPKATIADDDNTLDDGEKVVVACTDNLCQTAIVDPCADVLLPPCPGECPPNQFPNQCDDPCPGEGVACGNNIGDGMVCNQGIWECTVHPPAGDGCNLVCK